MKLFNQENSDFEVSISTHSIVRFIAIVIAALLLVVTIKMSTSTLVLLGTAVFLALVLNAPVRWLSMRMPGKNKNKRGLATMISILAIVLALVAFIWAIVPPVARQTTSFAKSAPTLISDTRDQNTAIGRFIQRNNLESQVEKLSSQLASKLADIGSGIISALSKIGSSVFAAVTVLVLTVMMLYEGPSWVQFMYQLIPARKRPHTKMLANKMLAVIQGYVNGQVTLASIAAILIVPVFFIMDVSYPIALMFVVFICGLIPMVGHTVGAIICTIIALFTSLPAALVVLGYYILYQQIENYAVQPRVQANSTNMSPLLVFIAVLLGANFGGLLGALVAIPLMGCVRILVLDYLERRDILVPEELADTPAPAPEKKKKTAKR